MKIQKHKSYNANFANFMAFRNYNTFATANYSFLIASSYQELTHQPGYIKNKLLSLDYFIANIRQAHSLRPRNKNRDANIVNKEPVRSKYSFKPYSYAKPGYFNQSLQPKYREDYYQKSRELAAKYQRDDNELLSLRQRIFRRKNLRIFSWSFLVLIVLSCLWLASGVIGNLR